MAKLEKREKPRGTFWASFDIGGLAVDVNTGDVRRTVYIMGSRVGELIHTPQGWLLSPAGGARNSRVFYSKEHTRALYKLQRYMDSNRKTG